MRADFMLFLGLVALRKRLAPVALLAAGIMGVFTACTPSIGDKCVLSTDCSTKGDRLCDTSQPDGYCTEFNCSKNNCPDEAACVFFDSKVPGCSYDDSNGNRGSRVARAFCSALCTKDADCRSGYICADPKAAPWNGIVIDDDQSKRTCLVIPASFYPDAAQPTVDASDSDGGLCSVLGPMVSSIDASPAQIYDGAAADAARDAGADAADASDAADAADADGG